MSSGSISDSIIFSNFSEKSQSNIGSDIKLEDKKFIKIFQIFNKFIVSASTSSLIIINQKLAHQRILYESFLKSMFESSEDLQVLAFPVELSLSKKQLILFKKIDSEFKSIGFKYELLDNQLKILSIPSQLQMNSVEEIIDNILNDEYYFDDSNSLSHSDFFAKKLSKSSSIKSGKKLNLNEQEFLVNQLFSCKEPNLSPDNKQIFITLSKNDIEKIF